MQRMVDRQGPGAECASRNRYKAVGMKAGERERSAGTQMAGSRASQRLRFLVAPDRNRVTRLGNLVIMLCPSLCPNRNVVVDGNERRSHWIAGVGESIV
jgi:hypothetical protein